MSSKKEQGKRTPRKWTFRHTTDKVGDVLENGAGVRFQITGERFAPFKGYDDGKTKSRILTLQLEQSGAGGPFEVQEYALKAYRESKIFSRVKHDRLTPKQKKKRERTVKRAEATKQRRAVKKAAAKSAPKKSAAKKTSRKK